MKFLFTGISSYIGQHVAAYLIEKGHFIVGISRSTQALEHPQLQFLRHDLETPLPLTNLSGIDAVIHFAADSHLGKSPREYFQSNLLVTKHVSDFASAIQPRVVFFSSTIKVYGQITTPVISEETPKVNPCNYGLTKFYGEQLLQEASPTVVLRLPGVITKGSHGWLNSVWENLRKDAPISLVDSPYNHVIHARDLGAFIDLFSRKDRHESQVLNFCANGVSSSTEVVGMLKSHANSSSPIVIQRMDPSFPLISNHRLRSLFSPMEIGPTIQLFSQEMQETIL
jgi:nucleoside-diphosphate-sugar epimerase